MFSFYKRGKRKQVPHEVMDVLSNLIIVIISLHIHGIAEYLVVHLKDIKFLLIKPQ